MSIAPVLHTVAKLGRERPRPDWVRHRGNAWWFAVGTVCFGAFMGQLDASIVTLTYGALGRQFGASLAGIQWVSLAYLILLAALLVPLGRLSDAHGRKQFYLYGFVVFTVASVACGLAWSLTALIVFRVLQAVGAALLQANSVALVVTSAPRPMMRTALGVQAGAQALGLALGPTIGGLLVSTIGWRWVFGINAPVGILGVLAGIYFLPRTRVRHPQHHFDWSGVLLLATVTTAVLMALSVFSGLPWPTWTVIVLLGAAVASAVVMVRRQSRIAEPLVATAVLKAPGLVVNLVGALCGYLVLFGPLVLVPVAFEAHARSAFSAGLILTALPVGFALAALALDKTLPRHWSNSRRAAIGALLCAISLAAMLSAPGHRLLLPLTLGFLGIGLGIFTPANNSLVMGRLPSGSSGTGGGLINMGRGIGTALGVALVTITWQLTAAHSDPARFRAVVLVLIAVAVGMIATSGERQRRLQSQHAV